LRLEVSINEALDFAIQNSVGVGFFVFSASIFNEFVWLENVVADLLAPFGRFAGAKVAQSLGLLLHLHLRKFATEDFHGGILVGVLATFILNCYDNASWDMGDTDSGVGRIDTLTTVATGTVNINTKILWVNLKVLLLCLWRTATVAVLV
jgi:hypothetical protein